MADDAPTVRERIEAVRDNTAAHLASPVDHRVDGQAALYAVNELAKAFLAHLAAPVPTTATEWLASEALGAREDCDLCVKGICSKHQPTQEQFDAMQAGYAAQLDPRPVVVGAGEESGATGQRASVLGDQAGTNPAPTTPASVPPLPTRVERWAVLNRVGHFKLTHEDLVGANNYAKAGDRIVHLVELREGEEIVSSEWLKDDKAWTQAALDYAEDRFTKAETALAALTAERARGVEGVVEMLAESDGWQRIGGTAVPLGARGPMTTAVIVPFDLGTRVRVTALHPKEHP